MKIKALFFIILIHWQQVTICAPPTTESLTEHHQPRRRNILVRGLQAAMYGLLPRCVYRTGDVDVAECDIVSDIEQQARAIVAASHGTLQREVERMTGAPSRSTEKNKVLEEDPMDGLTKTSEELWVHMARTCHDYGSLYHETLQANFIRFDNFDLKSVYQYLSYENKEAAALPYDLFKKLIEQREKEAKDEETQWLMRQFGFMFRNETSKHLYDVYLDGGVAAINKLALQPEEAEHLTLLREMAVEAKAELEAHRRSVARAAACQDKGVKKERTRRKKMRCVIC